MSLSAGSDCGRSILKTLDPTVDEPKTMTTAEQGATTRVLPPNRRKVYLVSFAFTAGWYVTILTLASLGDTNCSIEDCELVVTILAWALWTPPLFMPFACGLLLRPTGTPKRSVKVIGSALTAGTAVIALIVFSWINELTATPGGGNEANAQALTVGLMYSLLPVLGAGYLLVGLGSLIRRARASR
jgi:hypothetical protein